jgi:L-2-hydroxycarboxylate dehydrogenase (NAD+)
MKIKISELEKLIRDVLSVNYNKDEVKLMLPVAMFGELSGRPSHGILRVIVGETSIVAQTPKGKPKVEIMTNNSKNIEGMGNPGMLVGNMACNEAIGLAEKNGFAMVGTKGSIGSSGSLSYYCEKIANKDLIGIIMARAPADVAPHGGLERIYGTNPIAFGFPTNGKPMIFDMATSAISFGAVLNAKEKGTKLPNNVAIDKEGNPTTDPQKSLEGAFLPFDNSYKGAGLSMMVEILAGVLTGADFADMGVGDEWGNLYIVFKPALLSDTNVFKKRVNLLVEKVRGSRSVSGEKIRIVGEKTIKTRDTSLKSGEVEVDNKLYKQLVNYVKTGELI